MKVCHKLQVPAVLFSGMELPLPNEKQAVWNSKPLRIFGEENHLLFQPTIQTQLLGQPSL